LDGYWHRGGSLLKAYLFTITALPVRLAAVIINNGSGVMVLVYGLGIGRMVIGLLCFVVGVPLSVLVQMALLRRALRVRAKEFK